MLTSITSKFNIAVVYKSILFVALVAIKAILIMLSPNPSRALAPFISFTLNY